jgi:lyso-ornithine lipid O-acyltransferase
VCGARVTLTGKPLRPHTLLICNHVSWLDIPVLAGATGCAFVSKHELGHGLVHWLADQNATLYVRRDHRRGAPDQAEAIARKLGDPQPLALFPEGTTGPGTHLLPFRPTLFSAVAPPPEGVEVRPVAIDYGEAASELGWHEETGWRTCFGPSGGENPLMLPCVCSTRSPDGRPQGARPCGARSDNRSARFKSRLPAPICGGR